MLFLFAVFLVCLLIMLIAVLGSRLDWKHDRRSDPSPLQLLPPALPDGSHAIPLDGSEVFFPSPPHENPVYQITITGTVTIRPLHDYEPIERLDAFHQANSSGRFQDSNRHLLINHRQLYTHDHEWIEQDRATHRYVFKVGGLHHRLGLAFDIYNPRGRRAVEGGLVAAATVLPPGTLTPRQRDAAARAETEAARQVASRERCRAGHAALMKQKVDEQERQFWAHVNALRIEAQLLANWGDPNFQKDWATIHTDELLAQADEIRAKARAILSDTAVVQQLEKTDPGALAANLGKLGALTAAEQHSLQRKLSPPPPKKPKRSSKEVQELKVRYQRLELSDKLALAKDRIAILQDVKSFVKRQYADLGEDEQQAIVQQILDQVMEENNGKVF